MGLAQQLNDWTDWDVAAHVLGVHLGAISGSYRDNKGAFWSANGKLKIVVEHPDGTVHVGIPKPQSTHRTGGPPKYYDYGNFGHVGE